VGGLEERERKITLMFHPSGKNTSGHKFSEEIIENSKSLLGTL